MPSVIWYVVFLPRRCNTDDRLLVRRPLEALAANNAGAGLVVFLLGHPEVLEGREGSKNGTTNPDGVLSLGRSDDLDLFG